MKSFYEIKNKSLISNDLLNFALDQGIDKFIKPDHSNQIPRIKVPEELLINDPFIYNLIKEFNGTPIIFLYNPFDHYKWHVDEKRTCSINLSLNFVPSHCFFSNEENKVLFNISNTVRFTELIYKPDTYYLLDVTKYHCVYNFEYYRYMMSIFFPRENIGIIGMKELLKDSLI
jgi:hypothetical protein